MMPVERATPAASMSDMMPRSEKCMIRFLSPIPTPGHKGPNPDYSTSSCGRSGLEFRWTFGEQSLGPEGSLTGVVTFDDDFDTGAEDVRYDAGIGNGQRLTALSDNEGDQLFLVVTYN